MDVGSDGNKVLPRDSAPARRQLGWPTAVRRASRLRAWPSGAGLIRDGSRRGLQRGEGLGARESPPRGDPWDLSGSDVRFVLAGELSLSFFSPPPSLLMSTILHFCRLFVDFCRQIFLFYTTFYYIIHISTFLFFVDMSYFYHFINYTSFINISDSKLRFYIFFFCRLFVDFCRLFVDFFLI